MEVRKGLVYLNLALLDDVLTNSASDVVVKVQMVHENAKNLKPEVPPGDTSLTLWDAVTRRVQWRMIGIDDGPTTTSAPTTPSQSQTAPALILPEPQSACPPWTQSTPALHHL
jgi:hypothetical protein